MHVKAFNMITNKNKAKTMTEHISYGCKCKFNSTTCNSNQEWNNNTCQCECENYRKYKTDYILDPSMCICEDSKYLKSIAERSLIECDKIIIVIDNASTKKTNTLVAKETNTIANTIATNVACTSSINCHSKKVKDHYI